MPEKNIQTNIQHSFDSTLKDANLEGIAIDISEVGIDLLLDDRVLKDVPIVGTLVGLAKFGANVRDRLFLKKVLTFLLQIKDVTAEERKKMVDDIDGSKKYRVKVGEKLLYVIDACNDYEISELVGTLFKAYLEGKITYDNFLKASAVLQKMGMDDFAWFKKNGPAKRYFDLDDIGDLISSGLFELHYEQIDVRIEDETDKDRLIDGKKYSTDVDGGVSVHLTTAAETILEVFCPEYEKPKVIKL
ncbi:hypothetical protein KKH81_02985 [Patescibacteria group bacterium]|nr:hypothetical protein [Patescibacteria group bacterium]